MHYRLFQHDDFNVLYDIEEICFQPPERFSRSYMRELTSASNGATWLAFAQSDFMAGFAIVEWSRQTGAIVAYIATIEVLPEFRGRGIGVELMQRLEGSARAAGAAMIWLHVDLDNAPAIHLYERLGYRKTGRAENFYPRNRPAAIYAKNLLP